MEGGGRFGAPCPREGERVGQGGGGGPVTQRGAFGPWGEDV